MALCSPGTVLSARHVAKVLTSALKPDASMEPLEIWESSRSGGIGLPRRRLTECYVYRARSEERRSMASSSHDKNADLSTTE
jgi:hypothetical protein